MSEEAVIVRAHHCRKMGLCIDGIAEVCERHGIDFKEFIKNGISSDKISHIDDIYVKSVIAAARDSA